MVYRYAMYGLQMGSDCRLLYLTPRNEKRLTDEASAVDVFLYLAGDPAEELRHLDWQPYAPGQTSESGYRIYRGAAADGAYYRMEFKRGEARTIFTLSPDGAKVWMTVIPGGFSKDEVWQNANALLHGRVLNLVLARRGLLCLHGSAVAIHGRASVFLGDSGAGKSTLAAALLARGCSLLADDRSVLTEEGAGFQVQREAGRLRLWPDTLEWLHTPYEDLPRGLSSEEKRYLPLPESPVDQADLQLGAVYLLDQPEVKRLNPSAGLFHLLRFRMGAAYRSPAEAAGDYTRLARLAQAAPIYSLRRPADLSGLPVLVDALLKGEVLGQ